MSEYFLEVRLKTSKTAMTEVYPDEASAKAALQAFVNEVQKLSPVAVSTGGGIAVAKGEFEGASVKPRQFGSR